MELKDERVKKHLLALDAAAKEGDPEAFAIALRTIKADSRLTPVQRGAILKTIAQEQAASYAWSVGEDPTVKG